MMALQLPEPNDDAKALSRTLQAMILQRIHQQNSISFADYMQYTLYEPELGYYVGGAKRFAEGGDFITAPEITPLFGYCLADALAESLQEQAVLEFGAGTGKLACQLLQQWQQHNCLPQHYFILEVSPSLQTEQQESIAQLPAMLQQRVCWLSTLPENFTGLIIANEVLDAMPATTIAVRAGEIMERRVSAVNNQLCWQENKASAPIVAHLNTLSLHQQLRQFNDYCTEINLYHRAWLKSLNDCLRSGTVVLIDYGYDEFTYYHPQRCNGTLRCHYQQLAHDDPFYFPGLQDITTHVDFSTVQNSAKQLGFSISHFGSQAQFLIDNGLLDLFAQTFAKLPLTEQRLQSQALQKLTDPGQMGESFKVLILEK